MLNIKACIWRQGELSVPREIENPPRYLALFSLHTKSHESSLDRVGKVSSQGIWIFPGISRAPFIQLFCCSNLTLLFGSNFGTKVEQQGYNSWMRNRIIADIGNHWAGYFSQTTRVESFSNGRYCSTVFLHKRPCDESTNHGSRFVNFVTVSGLLNVIRIRFLHRLLEESRDEFVVLSIISWYDPWIDIIIIISLPCVSYKQQ